ncbi:MAG: hypothetical protein AB7O26_09005, partial [Planctomycetaceae bacterium]
MSGFVPDAAADGDSPQIEPNELIVPEVFVERLDVSAQTFASGMNGALHRKPGCEAAPVPLLEKLLSLISWKPSKPRVPTFGVSFPDGMEFLPPPKPKEAKENLKSIRPTQQVGEATAEAAAEVK